LILTHIAVAFGGKKLRNGRARLRDMGRF